MLCEVAGLTECCERWRDSPNVVRGGGTHLMRILRGGLEKQRGGPPCSSCRRETL